MVRRWVGPTPYDGVTGNALALSDAALCACAYREAMNSPVVVGLVAHLRELIKQCSQGHMSHWSNRMADDAQSGLAAYEAGLEPVKEDKHV